MTPQEHITEDESAADGVPGAVLDAMDAYIAAARAAEHTPHSWWMSPPIYDLFKKSDGRRPLRHRGLPIVVHDEWSWGWMLVTRGPYEYALPKPFDPSVTKGDTGDA